MQVPALQIPELRIVIEDVPAVRAVVARLEQGVVHERAEGRHEVEARVAVVPQDAVAHPEDGRLAADTDTAAHVAHDGALLDRAVVLEAHAMACVAGDDATAHEQVRLRALEDLDPRIRGAERARDREPLQDPAGAFGRHDRARTRGADDGDERSVRADDRDGLAAVGDVLDVGAGRHQERVLVRGRRLVDRVLDARVGIDLRAGPRWCAVDVYVPRRLRRADGGERSDGKAG